MLIYEFVCTIILIDTLFFIKSARVSFKVQLTRMHRIRSDVEFFQPIVELTREVNVCEFGHRVILELPPQTTRVLMQVSKVQIA